MDFSVARVIEMFEERFGRFLTTVLIGLIALALACVSVRTILDILVIPVVTLVRDAISNHPISFAKLIQTPSPVARNPPLWLDLILVFGVSYLIFSRIMSEREIRGLYVDLEKTYEEVVYRHNFATELQDLLIERGLLIITEIDGEKFYRLADITNPPVASPPSPARPE